MGAVRVAGTVRVRVTVAGTVRAMVRMRCGQGLWLGLYVIRVRVRDGV